MSASVPSSLALTSIADGASIIASDHRNNYSAVQTAVNALVAVLALATAKGDLVVATSSAVYDHLAVGANSKTIVADSTQTPGMKWDYPTGYEFAYTEFTSPVSVTATTEGTANTVVTSASFTFDGSTAVWVECFMPRIDTTAQVLGLVLLDGATVLGRGDFGSGTAATAMNNGGVVRRRLTPSAAAHTFTAAGFLASGSGTITVRGGAGGSGAFVPGFIRVTKA